MRDPMSWSVPLFRAFGITVRLHVLFFVITLGLFLRQVWQKDNPIPWFEVFAFTILLLFGIILLHEFGHCFGGRAVGGEATEILLWPLGGLAFVDAPHNPRAHMVTVAAGPGVNVVICLVAGLALVAGGFWPNANPFANPYVAEVKGFDGRAYTSPYGVKLYKPGSADPTPLQEAIDKRLKETDGIRERTVVRPGDAEMLASVTGADLARAPGWVVWVQRTFWLSWVLFLLNLLPAFPLDGGQMLQGVIWARSGSFRQGTVVACYSGFVVGLLLLIVSFAWNEAFVVGLCTFIFVLSYLKIHQLDQEDGVFGYDFSQGYTSLERDDPRPPPPKRPGPVKRWLQARQARRIQREQEERAQEEERMDQLLDKIAKAGKESLTDEERRFMERVSARYRNRS